MYYHGKFTKKYTKNKTYQPKYHWFRLFLSGPNKPVKESL